MSQVVRLAVLLVLVTILESAVPKDKRNVAPARQVSKPHRNPSESKVPKSRLSAAGNGRVEGPRDDIKANKNRAKKAPARKSAIKKSQKPQLKEFPLNAILFKGRETNEANSFIKSNAHRGKTLEQHYEHAREQDLNDIEEHLMRLYQDYKQLIVL